MAATIEAVMAKDLVNAKVTFTPTSSATAGRTTDLPTGRTRGT
jgi:hypothetical protein